MKTQRTSFLLSGNFEAPLENLNTVHTLQSGFDDLETKLMREYLTLESNEKGTLIAVQHHSGRACEWPHSPGTSHA